MRALSTPFGRLAGHLKVVTILATLALTAGACAPLTGGRETDAWLLRGSIAGLSSSAIEVGHKSGRTVTMALDAETTVEHDGERIDRAALAVDQRVSIRVEAVRGAWHARRVVVYSGIIP